jgi:3-methyladenine DNA glycosylase AlkD
MTYSSTVERPTSPVTLAAHAFVAKRRPAAERLGRDLADFLGDPEAFATTLAAGFRDLGDPEYLEGQRRIAPGIGALHGVRWPLIEATLRAFRAATRRDRSSATLLFVADRLLREPEMEAHWFAFGLLERLIAADPERTWQLIRRAARDAGDWVTIDTLARAVGRGVLAEPYRWAELEQLVFSPSRWERRLVGSTVATIPFIDRTTGRDPEVASRALPILETLIGDAEPDVQKALSWALRSLVLVDRAAVTAFCEAEAERAITTADGHRAWVIRDTLPKLEPERAVRLREDLAGVRKRPGAASTSAAAETAARFGGIGLGRPMPEPPLT